MIAKVWVDGFDRDLLKGWATFPNSPNQRVAVSIEVDGNVCGETVADKFRRDLLRKGISDGYSGFEYRIPARYLDGTRRRFRVTCQQDGNRSGGDDTSDELRGKPEVCLETPLLRLKSLKDKPWVLTTFGETKSAEAATDTAKRKLRQLLHRRSAIGTQTWNDEARDVFEQFPELFGFDTGVVEAVSSVRRVKTFRQMMKDRFEEWYGGQKDCLTRGNAWRSSMERKAEMRKLARESAIQLPKVFYSFDSPEAIQGVPLPAEYVAKADGFSVRKGVFVVSEGINLFDGTTVDVNTIAQTWRQLKSKRPDCTFVVEEFIQDAFTTTRSVIPLDYKFFVFGGKACLVEVYDRNLPHPIRTPYTTNWREIGRPLSYINTFSRHLTEPPHLCDLVESAERIGRAFGAFCRVDLYDSTDGVVFGELTVLPGDGLNFTPLGEKLLQQAAVLYERPDFWAE